MVLREWYRDRAARKEREKAEEIEWGIQRAYGQRIQEAYERGVSDGYEQHINDAYERGLDKGIDIGIEKGRKRELTHPTNLPFTTSISNSTPNPGPVGGM